MVKSVVDVLTGQRIAFIDYDRTKLTLEDWIVLRDRLGVRPVRPKEGNDEPR